jgi:hypothetical protein
MRSSVARGQAKGATEPPQGVLPHCERGKLLFCCWRSNKTGAPAPSGEVVQHPGYGRLEMSTIMKNKSLLLLPIGLAVLIVIGILTS